MNKNMISYFQVRICVRPCAEEECGIVPGKCETSCVLNESQKKNRTFESKHRKKQTIFVAIMYIMSVYAMGSFVV